MARNRKIYFILVLSNFILRSRDELILEQVAWLSFRSNEK